MKKTILDKLKEAKTEAERRRLIEKLKHRHVFNLQPPLQRGKREQTTEPAHES